MSTRIFRYEVPVDDQWHEIELHGDPLAVGCRRLDVVEFWAFNDVPASDPQRRHFIVAGTGQQLPEQGQLRHWGTAVAPEHRALVWHLLERPS